MPTVCSIKARSLVERIRRGVPERVPRAAFQREILSPASRELRHLWLTRVGPEGCYFPAVSGELVFRSELNATAEVVWRSVSSPEGIRYELSPLIRMTFPREVRELSEEAVPLGRRLCRSWILLLGVLPIDYDDVTIVELERGRRFLERSPTLSQREWVHERTVVPMGDRCVVTDRLEVHPKVAAMGGIIRAFVRGLFSHRHRRLIRKFGGEM